jgi:glycine oxidase
MELLPAGLVTEEAILESGTVVLACGAGIGRLLTGWPWREAPGCTQRFLGPPGVRHSLEWAGETLVPLPRGEWRVSRPDDLEPRLHRLLACHGRRAGAPLWGTRVAPPDGLPVAGRWRERLFVLGGLGRNGLLTAPLLARGLAEELVTGLCPDWLSPFSPCRSGIGQRRSWSR